MERVKRRSELGKRVNKGPIRINARVKMDIFPPRVAQPTALYLNDFEGGAFIEKVLGTPPTKTMASITSQRRLTNHSVRLSQPSMKNWFGGRPAKGIHKNGASTFWPNTKQLQDPRPDPSINAHRGTTSGKVSFGPLEEEGLDVGSIGRGKV